MARPSLVLALVLAATSLARAAPEYPFASAEKADSEALEARFPAPAGFSRVPLEAGSFGAWLRALPLLPRGAPVRTHAGEVLEDADAVAVVDLDVGTRDLQQCADSIIRLRAEWLHGRSDTRALAFTLTNGDRVTFDRWARGERPRVKGSKVMWSAGPARGKGRPALRSYLDFIFTYAGTASLARDEKQPVGPIAPGDFYVEGGHPGHAVLVLDVARAEDGRVALLVGQGYMPAQSFHVVPTRAGAAWHVLENDDAALRVPTWPAAFGPKARRRFQP